MPRGVDQLEEQVEALRGKLQQLHLQHSALRLEHSLLQALCDTLHWIRVDSVDKQLAVFWQPHNTSMQLWSYQQQRDQIISSCMRSEECLLLQQLSKSSPYMAPKTPPLPVESATEFEPSLLHRKSSGLSCNSSFWGADSAVDHFQKQSSNSFPCSACQSGGSSGSRGGVECCRSLLAPDPDDMLFQLRRLLSRPPLANAKALRLDQLQALYQMNVYELSLATALVDNPFISTASIPSSSLNPAAVGQTAVKQAPATNQQQPTDAVLAAITKYFHVIVSMVLQGRKDLVVAFQHTNMLTGEMHEQVYQQVAPQLHWAMQKAALSQQQLQRIATGTKVRKRLLLQLSQSQQKLLQQIAASCGVAGDTMEACAQYSSRAAAPAGGHMTVEGSFAGHMAAAAGAGQALWYNGHLAAVDPFAGQNALAQAVAPTTTPPPPAAAAGRLWEHCRDQAAANPFAGHGAGISQLLGNTAGHAPAAAALPVRQCGQGGAAGSAYAGQSTPAQTATNAAPAAAATLPLPVGAILRGSLHLAERERLFKQLHLLQMKENLLCACFLSFTLGSLTPMQVSKLVLSMFPYPLDLTAVEFMAEVMATGSAE